MQVICVETFIFKHIFHVEMQVADENCYIPTLTCTQIIKFLNIYRFLAHL